METVQVAVRIRPLSPKEVDEGAQVCCFVPEEDRCQISLGDRSFTFDNVLSPSCEPFEVYSSCCASLLQSYLEGFNCTIFAYGQTGSGKTFSVEELIEHFVPSLFDALEALRGEVQVETNSAGDVTTPPEGESQPGTSRNNVDYTIRVSAMEIYNDVIRDLLPSTVSECRPSDLLTDTAGNISLKDSEAGEIDASHESPSIHQNVLNKRKGLSIRETQNGAVTVNGLTEKVVDNAFDVLHIIGESLATRTVGDTQMNEESSRSHAIITVTLEQRRVVSTDPSSEVVETIVSKFRLVDLAGSERQKKTGATGFRLKESIHINSGLLSLGNVISSLCEREENPVRRIHIPYRDSKLTRVLQDSLGGNSVTVMLACISPADINFEETLNTLKYANRAKNIRNKPTKNTDPQMALIQSLRKELTTAKSLLSQHGIPFASDSTTGSARGTFTPRSDAATPRQTASSSHRSTNESDAAVIGKCTRLLDETTSKLPAEIRPIFTGNRKNTDLVEKLRAFLRWSAETSMRVEDMERHISRLASRPDPCNRTPDDADCSLHGSSPAERRLSVSSSIADGESTPPDYDRITRERTDIVNERLDLTARRRALQIERENFEKQQIYHGQTLEAMESEIKSREKIIHELIMREYEAQRIVEEYTENIHVMETERNRAQGDLAKALKEINVRSLSKENTEKETRRLQTQADVRIRQLEHSIAGLRKKQTEAEGEMRQHRVEKDQLRKLSAELNRLREQHDTAQAKIREAALRSAKFKKEFSTKEKFLMKQLENIEHRNMMLLRSLDKKDAEIKRMRMSKPRTSPPPPRPHAKGMHPVDRYMQISRTDVMLDADEVECRKSNSRFGIDATLDVSALNAKRQVEEQKLRDLRLEREDAVLSRQELAKQHSHFQSETKEQIKKSLIGWNRRIAELANAIEDCAAKSEEEGGDESDASRLKREKEHAEKSHAQVLHYAQTHEQSLLDGIRKADDAIDSLDASIAFHVNRYYLFSQQAKRGIEGSS